MKKRLLTLLLVFLAYIGYSQTTGLKGTILLPDGKPAENATVSIIGTNYTTSTNADGLFSFENMTAGLYKIGVFFPGYESYYSTDIRVKRDEVTEIESIKLSVIPVPDLSDLSENSNDEDVNADFGADNVTTILHGSRDAFVDAASYALGPFGFQIRGYDDDYTETTINGADVMNLENGRIYWSEWGGLNDVTRMKNVTFGLDPADNSFANIGGATDIQMMPSIFRKGLKVSYSRTNRNYRNRLMATYSTGLMANNWAFSVSGSRRWAQEGYVDGTFYDAWGYYLGIEKKFTKHNIILNVFGAPITRGKQGPSVQETYDLLENVYYNPYWGYQNGKKRNSRVAKTHEPIAVLTHIWFINSTTKLSTTFLGRYGRNGGTTLNWYNAPDPRPDYYRYLPSYITNEDEAQIVADSFLSPNYSQINWANIYYANSINADTVYNADGITGNTVMGNRALYIIEENRYDQLFLTGTTNLSKTINENFKMVGGLTYKYFEGRNFKTINDLLGADYWLDIDKYAEREYSNIDSSQSNLDSMNNIIYEGQVFGYNYKSHVQYEKAWFQTTFDNTWLNATLSGYVSYTSMYREGLMRVGKFPNNSFGNSPTLNFLDYGGKLALIFKINGRNFVQAHAGYLTQAPNFNYVYLSPRTRDLTITNPVSEKVLTADLGYVYRSPNLKITLNGFYTEFRDQCKVMSFYHDGYANFVNYAMSNIDKTHQGLEMAIDGNITSSLSGYIVGALGYYRYSSRPLVTVTIDNSSELLAVDKVVYMDNYIIPSVPQSAGSVGLRYRAPKFWFFNVNANYVQDMYLDFNPERRTAEAVLNIVPESAQWNAIVDQQKLPSAWTIDGSIGKSLRIMHKYTINFNLSVNNILDSKKIITGGFEQLRYDLDTQDPEKFPSKYFYMYGRQYFFNVSLSF